MGSEENAVIETKSNSFTKDKICSYEISVAQSDAQIGDLVYLKLDEVEDVLIQASIGPSLTQPQSAVCWLQSNDAIVAKYPDSIFLSFVS